MGIVPFVGYVNEHPKPWNVSMLFGHREPISCYPVDSINEHVPLDSLRENTPGDLDNFIFSLQERMREYAEQKGLVLACGPLPFLRTVHTLAKELGVRTQLSLENRMACGVGALPGLRGPHHAGLGPCLPGAGGWSRPAIKGRYSGPNILNCKKRFFVPWTTSEARCSPGPQRRTPSLSRKGLLFRQGATSSFYKSRMVRTAWIFPSPSKGNPTISH